MLLNHGFYLRELTRRKPQGHAPALRAPARTCRPLVIGTVAVVFGLCRSAAAAQSAHLVYSRAPQAVACVDEQGLREAVAQRLGYDPFVAVSTRTLVAELFGTGDQLGARVYVVENGNITSGTRELWSRSGNCGELIAAVALAISIAVDPDSIDRVAENSAPATSPEADVDGAADAAPDSAEPRRAAAIPPADGPPRSLAGAPGPARVAAQRTTHWAFGAGGFVTSGPAPGPAFGVVLLAALRVGHWGLGFEPRWTLASSTKEQGGIVGTATVSSYGASLAPCYRAGSWLACYMLDAALLVSEGHGLSQPNTNQSWWLAQGPRLGYRLGSDAGLGTTLRIDGLWAAERITMRLDGHDAFETPRFCVRLGFDADYEL